MFYKKLFETYPVPDLMHLVKRVQKSISSYKGPENGSFEK
jgi:hypothetical protein